MVAYDSEKQTWFGIGMPNSNEVISFSSNVLSGTNYLCVGGDFLMQIGNIQYRSLALYNLDTESWDPFAITLNFQTVITGTLLNNTGSIILSGRLYIPTGSSNRKQGVATTNFYGNPPTLSTVGSLPEQIGDQIALYTDANSNQIIFAAGSFSQNGGNYPLVYSLANAGSGTNWAVAGSGNALYGYTNKARNIIYMTGGKGINGENA